MRWSKSSVNTGAFLLRPLLSRNLTAEGQRRDFLENSFIGWMREYFYFIFIYYIFIYLHLYIEYMHFIYWGASSFLHGTNETRGKK